MSEQQSSKKDVERSANDQSNDFRGSAMCPLCGRVGPHEHTGLEQLAYRNGVKAGSLRQLAVLKRIAGATGGNGLPFANKWARSVAEEAVQEIQS